MSDIQEPELSAASEEFVNALTQEYILAEAMNYQPGLVVDTRLKPYFDAKSMIYRLAVTLMVIMNEEEENPNLSEVRERIEYLLLTSLESGEDLINEVEQAIQKLGVLLFSKERKEFSWGISWFEEIGISETDPINLAMFAKKWMGQFTMVTKIVRNFVDEARVS